MKRAPESVYDILNQKRQNKRIIHVHISGEIDWTLKTLQSEENHTANPAPKRFGKIFPNLSRDGMAVRFSCESLQGADLGSILLTRAHFPHHTVTVRDNTKGSMSRESKKEVTKGVNIGVKIFDDVRMPAIFVDHLETMKSRDMRADDIVLSSYPKSGTHWVWEILNMIVAGKAEYHKHWLKVALLEYRTEEELEKLESPRIFHTHQYPGWLPNSVWRKKCKIMYLQRNPKDCLVSKYCQEINQVWTDYDTENQSPIFAGTWEDYLDINLTGEGMFGSWFDYAAAWNHAIDSHPSGQIYKVNFEDLRNNCEREIKKMAEYLERPASDSICSEIAEACRFENLKHVCENVKDQTFHMKWKEGSSGYFRKGVVGDWKNWLTVTQNEKFDRVYEEKLGKKFSSYDRPAN